MVTIYVLREKKQIFFYITRYSNSEGRNFTLSSYILPALSLVRKMSERLNNGMYKDKAESWSWHPQKIGDLSQKSGLKMHDIFREY